MTSSPGMIRMRLSDGLTGASLVLTCLFLLSGCLFNRVQEVKAQTCDFERNFTLEFGAVTSLTFHEPILLKSDIERLLDFEPSEETLSGSATVQRYRVAQVAADGLTGAEYDFVMRFVTVGDDWRLASVHMPQVVNRFIDEPSVARAAQRACEAEWRWAGLGIAQTLAPEDLELLPTRSQLIAALGAPTAVNARGESLTWAFRPLAPGLPTDVTPVTIPETRLAEVTVHFDGDVHPERLEGVFRGMRAEADFRSLEARFSYRGGGVKK